MFTVSIESPSRDHEFLSKNRTRYVGKLLALKSGRGHSSWRVFLICAMGLPERRHILESQPMCYLRLEDFWRRRLLIMEIVIWEKNPSGIGVGKNISGKVNSLR